MKKSKKFKDVYFLKKEVTIENIWNCIRETLKDSEISLPTKVPKKFICEGDNEKVSFISKDKYGLADFIYSGSEEGKTKYLRICFDYDIYIYI